VAVVFYSSDLSELVHVCHRVLVMAEGRPRGILDAADGQLSEHGILRLAVGQHEGDAVPLATVSAP
jgi:ABC-type sugar transport system ATPase subunit